MSIRCSHTTAADPNHLLMTFANFVYTYWPDFLWLPIIVFIYWLLP